MSKAVIPTLSINMPVLENTSDKLIYILKFLFYSPGWISNWYDNYLLSLRKSMATYTENSSVLVPHLQSYINEAIHRYYTDYNCKIGVTRDEENQANYTMNISITDSMGNTVMELGKVRKDESNLFTFEGIDDEK